MITKAITSKLFWGVLMVGFACVWTYQLIAINKQQKLIIAQNEYLLLTEQSKQYKAEIAQAKAELAEHQERAQLIWGTSDIEKIKAMYPNAQKPTH